MNSRSATQSTGSGAPSQNQDSPADQDQAAEAAFGPSPRGRTHGVCKPVSLLETEHRFSPPESPKQLRPPPGVRRSKVTLRPLLLSTKRLPPHQVRPCRVHERAGEQAAQGLPRLPGAELTFAWVRAAFFTCS